MRNISRQRVLLLNIPG